MNEKVPFWTQVLGNELRQGDFLRDCVIPVFSWQSGATVPDDLVKLDKANLVVVTQSCDLKNNKVHLVALCPIFTVGEYAIANARFEADHMREEVRKGRVEGLHMLAPTDALAGNRNALIVDFRMIHTLPIAYLAQHADGMGARWRLNSPFLEHFSQAFARFFMRVGLPSAIEPFVQKKNKSS
jgi:hypothetical protein